MTTRAFRLLSLLAAAAIFAACSGNDDAADGDDDTAGADSPIGDDAEASLLNWVEGDAEEYGAVAGCGWLVSKGERTTAAPIDLLDLDGEFAIDWGSGTVGNLDGQAETQFATVYQDGLDPSAELVRSEGDGWVCFDNVP